MDRLPLRTLFACVALLAGLALAQALVRGPVAWLLAFSLAAAATALFVIVLDWIALRRLARWVAAGSGGAAPRGPGPVGDLGYRFERAMKVADDRTRAEQRRLAQFLSAIEASPNGVLLLDEQDHIQWFNQVAAEHFGLDGLRDREQRITHLVRAPAFVAHLQAGEFDSAVSFQAPRGDMLLSVLVRPYGGLSEASKLVLSQDITERERSDTMRRDFVANVSHEIRSPLTVLAGFVETLSTLPLTDVERERVLTLMRQQTQRMQNLVTDLLALARIEGAPRPPTDAWVDVAALLQHVDTDARASDAAQHRIELDLGGGGAVNGDESELFSAVGNLVSNALRYTPAGGSVKIGWSVRADGSGEFAVADSGVGIAKEHIPRLTERFYRVDSSRSRETGGTGLGLAIVKHVVQRHGGSLLIESVPGKGSSFRIVLPAHRVRRAAAASLSATA